MNWLKKFMVMVDKTNIFLGKINVGLIMLAVTVITFEVVARYVFGMPTNWGHELMTLLFAASYVLAGGYAHMFTVDDATWLLKPRCLLPALTGRRLRRRWEDYCAAGVRLVASGFDAYREGRPGQAARYFLQACCCRPWLLMNRGVISILAEAALGRELLSRYRRWKGARRSK